MPTSNAHRSLEFGSPARYRILVQGALSEGSSRRFADMTVESIPGDGQAPRAVIAGRVRDQAELRGLLDALYGLHLTLLAVECCDNRDEPREEQPRTNFND